MKGWVLWIVTVALLVGDVRGQTVEEILARSIEARGGWAALQAWKPVKMTARVERHRQGSGYTTTLYRKRPAGPGVKPARSRARMTM